MNIKQYFPLLLILLSSTVALSGGFFHFLGVFALIAFSAGLLNPGFSLPFLSSPNRKNIITAFAPLMVISALIAPQQQNAFPTSTSPKDIKVSQTMKDDIEVPTAEVKVTEALIPTATATPSPLPTATFIPTRIPTNTPMPVHFVESTSTQSTNNGYVCNCAKTCPNLSCDEAYFQLLQCGCSQRDGDGDGVPCEAQCR